MSEFFLKFDLNLSDFRRVFRDSRVIQRNSEKNDFEVIQKKTLNYSKFSTFLDPTEWNSEQFKLIERKFRVISKLF